MRRNKDTDIGRARVYRKPDGASDDWGGPDTDLPQEKSEPVEPSFEEKLRWEREDEAEIWNEGYEAAAWEAVLKDTEEAARQLRENGSYDGHHTLRTPDAL